MDNNELLLAISTMLDTKLKSELQPIKNDIQDLRNEIHQVKLFQDNILMPRLNTIESCYLDTYKRYKNYSDKMDAAFEDIDIMKKVIISHSEQLQKIS